MSGLLGHGHMTTSLLGFEVVKPFKILIKILNAVKHIESYYQNIEAPMIDDPII